MDTVALRPPREFTLTSRAGSLQLAAAPKLVGILNVTPDSFYDGGRYVQVPDAIRRGLDLFASGASWVDVGGMSTRPGSDEIPAEEESARVVAVIEGLRSAAGPAAWISVDTYRASVAESAIHAGATCVNDVSGFSLDPRMCEVAASADCPVVINHMKGVPRTMQAGPIYDSVWDELLHFFESRLDQFVRSGGDERHVVFDPGIGFGKSPLHNLEILRGIDRLHRLGRPIFLGCSRKSFIEHLTRSASASSCPSALPASDRLPGSLAAAIWAALLGVQMLRVHDVAETAQCLNLFLALSRD